MQASYSCGPFDRCATVRIQSILSAFVTMTMILSASSGSASIVVEAEAKESHNCTARRSGTTILGTWISVGEGRSSLDRIHRKLLRPLCVVKVLAVASLEARPLLYSRLRSFHRSQWSSRYRRSIQWFALQSAPIIDSFSRCSLRSWASRFVLGVVVVGVLVDRKSVV